jgi:CDP-diacylglycerol--glycerol-3-phosphate 3-phosphatidyltransferase
MLDIRARKNVSRVADPVARVIAKIGLGPTAITIFGLVLSLTGAVLVGMGYLAAGAGTLGAGALLDILDGVVARITDRETVRGAFLDSITDRVSEVAVWTGLAFYLGDRAEATLVLLSIVAVCGSLLIPYVRSKAESFGVDGKGGLLGRAERLLLFGFGIGLEGVGLPTMEATLWILAVGTWLTVAQRFVRTWKRLGA